MTEKNQKLLKVPHCTLAPSSSLGSGHIDFHNKHQGVIDVLSEPDLHFPGVAKGFNNSNSSGNLGLKRLN